MIIKCQYRRNVSPLKTLRLRDLYNNSPQSGGQSGCFLFSWSYLKFKKMHFQLRTYYLFKHEFPWMADTELYDRLLPNAKWTGYRVSSNFIQLCISIAKKINLLLLQPGLAKWSWTSNFTNILCVFSVQKSTPDSKTRLESFETNFT